MVHEDALESARQGPQGPPETCPACGSALVGSYRGGAYAGLRLERLACPRKCPEGTWSPCDGRACPCHAAGPNACDTCRRTPACAHLHGWPTWSPTLWELPGCTIPPERTLLAEATRRD